MSRLPAHTSPRENLFAELDGEMWLARRLALHSLNILEGETDTSERRQRFRQAIKDHHLAHVIVGRGKDSKPVSYQQAFERLYHEKL